MGRIRKTLALATIAGLVVPPIAAAIAKQRLIPMGDELADEIALVTIFDGTRFTSRSTAFRGGSTLCWYGGLDLDLREARLDPAGARLQVRSLFGGTRIIVPEGWQVRVRATPIAGGVSDETAGGAGSGPMLEVEALVAFSGVQITSHVDDEDALIPPPGHGADAGSGADRAEVLARAEAEAGAEAEASARKRASQRAKKAAQAGADAGPTAEAPAEEQGPSGSNGG